MSQDIFFLVIIFIFVIIKTLPRYELLCWLLIFSTVLTCGVKWTTEWQKKYSKFFHWNSTFIFQHWTNYNYREITFCINQHAQREERMSRFSNGCNHLTHFFMAQLNLLFCQPLFIFLCLSYSITLKMISFSFQCSNKPVMVKRTVNIALPIKLFTNS